jgi:hypothetical protein
VVIDIDTCEDDVGDLLRAITVGRRAAAAPEKPLLGFVLRDD